jgi:integrase
VANLFKLTQDNRGRWRRQNLGRKGGAGAQLVPATFFLGTDYEEACKRVVLLEQMWEAVTKTWAQIGSPVWRLGTYEIALAVARGEKDITITPPAWADTPSQQAGYLADQRALFPFLNISYDHPLAQENADRVADHLEKDAHAMLGRARSINRTVAGTLHEALDAYHAYVTEKYAGRSNQRPQQRLVALLKKHSANVPLDRFDADAIDHWLAAWCKRPAGEGGPLALTTCRNTLIGLRQFVRWLSRSAAFSWEMPRGYTFPRCRIDKLPADRVKRRQHFNRTELALLWEYAHPWDRALILLALNCGFSKREIATLQKGEIVQRKESTFIQRHRTKSDVYHKNGRQVAPFLRKLACPRPPDTNEDEPLLHLAARKNSETPLCPAHRGRHPSGEHQRPDCRSLHERAQAVAPDHQESALRLPHPRLAHALLPG